MPSDLLSRLLRRADPGTVHRGDPLSARGLAQLAPYQAAEDALPQPATGSERAANTTPRRNRDRNWAWATGRVTGRARLLTGVSAVTVVVVAVLVVSIAQPVPAVAATPPMLDLTPVTATATALLEEMHMTRRHGAPSGHTIRAQTWSLNTTIGDDGQIVSSQVEPQWSETTFQDDGTVRYLLTAGKPFHGQDADTLPEPGQTLADETFAPGHWDFPAADGPPSDPSEVGAYLARLAQDDHLTAGQTLQEIAGILSVFPLTNQQEAALIGHLATLDHLTVAGQTTDRLGRTGIAFRATDRATGQFEDWLIISPDTGQVLAAETIYVGTDRTDITSPAVIDYIAWEH